MKKVIHLNGFLFDFKQILTYNLIWCFFFYKITLYFNLLCCLWIIYHQYKSRGRIINLFIKLKEEDLMWKNIENKYKLYIEYL